MNNEVWKKNQAVCAQYAQALRIIREQVGENPARDLERTGRIEAKTLGNLIDVVSRHHETLSALEDPEFFACGPNRTGSLHDYQAVTPVGTFLFGLDFSKRQVVQHYCY